MKLIDWDSKDMNTLMEVPVFIDYELGDNNEVSVMAVWMVKPGLDDIEITGYLSPADMDAAESMVLWELEKSADRAMAMREDAAESRREIALEIQAEALAQNENQRGVKL